MDNRDLKRPTPGDVVIFTGWYKWEPSGETLVIGEKYIITYVFDDGVGHVSGVYVAGPQRQVVLLNVEYELI